MKRKFQRSCAALLDVVHGAVALDLAVVLAGGAEGLVELLQQVRDLEVRGRLGTDRSCAAARAPCRRPRELAAGRVVDLGDVLGQLFGVEERGDGNRFLGFLVDHQRHADAAVGVAAAGELAPVVFGSVTRSAQSEKVHMKQMGNQSRAGSPRPIWFLTSCARCESV